MESGDLDLSRSPLGSPTPLSSDGACGPRSTSRQPSALAQMREQDKLGKPVASPVCVLAWVGVRHRISTER